MCFSNLPIEFDDDGNPYLADEADDVDRPSDADEDHPSACGYADVTDDVALDESDPEAIYEEILETMPSDVREQLTDSDERPGRVGERERPKPGHTN
ncbi:hypothetical protein [Natrinema salifodinae]|nr:hypothetical protein [Natrinema salifodinae]